MQKVCGEKFVCAQTLNELISFYMDSKVRLSYKEKLSIIYGKKTNQILFLWVEMKKMNQILLLRRKETVAIYLDIEQKIVLRLPEIYSEIVTFYKVMWDSYDFVYWLFWFLQQNL